MRIQQNSIKKGLLTILALALAFSMIGCGDTSKDNKTNTVPSSSASYSTGVDAISSSTPNNGQWQSSTDTVSQP